MEIAKIKYINDLRTEAIHVKSGKKIITDAPIDNQGRGEAFSPTDLLCTSLASCALTIIGIAARTHNINIDNTEIEISKTMLSDPRRIGEIILKFKFPSNNYTEKEKKLIINAAKTCPVAKSLNSELKQTYIFNF